MKNVLLIIFIALVPSKFCLAQNLDMDKVSNNWDDVVKDFVAALQKNECFPDDIQKDNNFLYVRIINPQYFKDGINKTKEESLWKIPKNKYEYFQLQDSAKAKAYDSIRVAYLKSLEKKGYAKQIADPKQTKTEPQKKTKLKDKDIIDSLSKSVDTLQKVVSSMEQNMKDSSNVINKLLNKINELENILTEEKGSKKILVGLLAFIIVAVLIIICIFIKVIRKLKRKNRDLNKSESDLKTQNSQLQDDVNSLNTTIASQKEDSVKKDEQIRENTAEIARLQQAQNNANNKNSHNIKKDLVPTNRNGQSTRHEAQINRTNVKYLCQISIDGYFGRVQDSNDGSYYCIYDINGDKAKYEFCGNSEEALQKYPSVLDPVAEYTGIPENASKIKTIVPGIVIYNHSTGKYDIDAKVQLELY